MTAHIFYTALLIYAATFFLYLLRLRRSEFFVGLAAFLLNGIALVVLFSGSGQVPVFTLFEGFLFIAFILGGFGLYSSLRGSFLSVNNPDPGVRGWVWAEILVLLLILLMIPKQPAFAAYDRGDLFIILFHLFRMIAFALILYASAYFIEFGIQKRMDRGEQARALTHGGRNFLILSAVFFLSGEYAGILWSQRGWGDFWHWNSAFFQSTLIILYLMIALHVPGKGRKAEGVRSLVGGMAGFVVLVMMIIRSFY